MGGESNPNKPHYDITLSRRTRRARTLFGEKVSALKVEDKQVVEENEEEKRKMKFMDIFGGKEEEEECKNSLAGHFTEEDKQRQLVVRHEKEHNTVSLKKMVGRCAKMWSHMIKIKGGSRKKRVLQLTM